MHKRQGKQQRQKVKGRPRGGRGGMMPPIMEERPGYRQYDNYGAEAYQEDPYYYEEDSSSRSGKHYEYYPEDPQHLYQTKKHGSHREIKNLDPAGKSASWTNNNY